MFLHNLKIAFRNVRKYKKQTLISLFSLSIGFVCFSLSMLWIRYEMNFDGFHKNAKQMYVVYTASTLSQTGFDRLTPTPLAAYLKETFPEIANATPLELITYFGGRGTVTVENDKFPAVTITVDSSFLRMFDVRILAGSKEFLIPGSNKFAITLKKARQLFGNESPIGKAVNDGANEICAVVSEMPGHSNYSFDFMRAFRPQNPEFAWRSTGSHTIIELHPGIDFEAFEKKLYEHETGEGRNSFTRNMKIKPLIKIRLTDPVIERDVKFQHILIFALSGLLVVLCSLFNYLTLFVSRFRIRQKEFALRMVCGASGRSLLAMLSVEFILILLFAVVFGCVLTQLMHKLFFAL